MSRVWIPDPECEAARDLVRYALDATSAMKSSKQHVSSMLLRHGWAWNERTATGNLKATWTRGYVKWAKSADLGEPASNEALRRYILIAEEDIGRVDEARAELRKLASLPRWKPYVDAISLVKGVDWFGALLVAAEIGDFDRFKGGRDVSKWIGTVPSESSSGEGSSHGRITRAGNSHVRTVLLEGMAGASLRTPGAKKAKKGQAVSPDVAAVCSKASKRLKSRFDHLVGQGLPVNKAKIAVVNELIRWIWAVGKMVQAEQRALAAHS
jgi:transposase